MRDFRYSEKSQYYSASHTVTDMSQSWKKSSLWGWDREVLYGKSPGLIVHDHTCMSDHVVKRNLTIKKEHIVLLDTWLSLKEIFDQPQVHVLQNQIKLTLNRLCRFSASF